MVRRKDVCLTLGWQIGGVHGGTTKRLGTLAPDEKRTAFRSEEVFLPLFAATRAPSVTLISESGLYKLVLRAHPGKAEVAKFQNWVTQTVLPSIRKDGGYVLGEEKVATGELSEDEFIFKAMSMLQAKAARLTEERDEALKAQALAEKQRDNNRAAADALAATVGTSRNLTKPLTIPGETCYANPLAQRAKDS